MKDYSTVPLKDEIYSHIIFANSCESCLFYLEDIINELKSQKTPKSKMIFDMLLCTGNSEDRYIEVVFDGDTFIKSSFKDVFISKKDNIRKISSEYIKSNMEILDNSILTSAQIKMIGKGIVL